MAIAGHGGKREGAGAKKGQQRVTITELREAMDKSLGMSYAEMLAETASKLFIDFKNDKHVREHVSFTNNMMQRLVEAPIQEVAVTTSEMSAEEIKAKILLLTTNKTNIITHKENDNE